MSNPTDGPSPTRRSLPTWLKGFGNSPLGATGSIMLITVPQLLAANHVPEVKIASVTAFGLLASFIGFPFNPILDWRFSRRFYAILFAILGAALSFAALMSIHNLTLLAALLFASSFSVQLCIGRGRRLVRQCHRDRAQGRPTKADRLG